VTLAEAIFTQLVVAMAKLEIRNVTYDQLAATAHEAAEAWKRNEIARRRVSGAADAAAESDEPAEPC
jgi:hypothetical protein